ncbi:MAG: rhodanese-like domain-containing protein, partial [Peptococcaceae bacterium]|nr:rhodanese-like domain-containing protein [Peptococcaceae bacterium]
MKRVLIVGLIFIVLGGVLMFFFGKGQQTKYENVTATQAEKLLAGGHIVVIDVREPFEFAEGHIPGAMLIPLGV